MTERTLLFVLRLSEENYFNWVTGERKNWSVDDHWKNWIFSDECQVEIGNNNRVYIWQIPMKLTTPISCAHP